MNKKCICNEAGYCHTHKRDMPEEFWKACKSSEDYYRVFQKDRHRRYPPWYASIGDLVFHVLRLTGVGWLWKRLFPSCGCDNRRRWLNDLSKRLWRRQ